ncbi:MAG TPA: response regulator [Ramlibacter sp.]
MSEALATIVAVDDKEANLRLLKAYLQAEPYFVHTFADPRIALDAIERLEPDLILLDLMMPVMDGFEFLAHLKDRAPHVPVIVVTALDDRDARLRGLAAGVRDFLTKPIDRTELLLRVRNLVALKQSLDSLESALRELRMANRDLEAFAASLAHDLQQPIMTISAFAQVMQGKSQDMAPDSAQHLQKIQSAAITARTMIKALLEFARLGQATLDTTPVDLAEVVEEARNTVTANTQAGAVRWAIEPLPVVPGDRALLLLAFINLFSNAVKYSRTQPQPAISIEVERQPFNEQAIRVRDNGVGFDMEHASRLFNPFERLHSAKEFEGTGMGLANVRRIVEKHGGRVQAESEAGKGAVFTVVLKGT